MPHTASRPIYTTIGCALDRARFGADRRAVFAASRHLSRSALASAASTSITTIRRWERGDFRFLPDEALRRSVAKALGVSLAQLTRSLEVSRASQDQA